MFKHFSWAQLPKKGAIGIGLFASLFLVPAIQSPASSQTADGTSAIEDSFFEDEGEDSIDENLNIADFSYETVEREDNNSALASLFASRGYSSTSCGWVTHTGYGRNILGWTLASYNQQIYRCWNGQTLLSAYRQNRWAEVYSPLWEFVGHAGGWTSRNGNTFTSWTQGHFKLCVAYKIGCVQNIYPTISSSVSGWGNNWYSIGGGFGRTVSTETEDQDPGIFFSEDIDESTRAMLVGLIENNNGNTDSQSVPEPTTLAGLALVGAMLLASKRSRFAKQHPEEAENVTDTTAVEIQ